VWDVVIVLGSFKSWRHNSDDTNITVRFDISKEKVQPNLGQAEWVVI